MPHTMPVHVDREGEGILTLTSPGSGVLKIGHHETRHAFAPGDVEGFLKGANVLRVSLHGASRIVRSYIRGA